MAVVIREADLDTELELLASTVNATFHMQIPLARFRWLYLDNPDGRAIAWFAIDESSGAVAGCTAVSPRRVGLGPGRAHVVAWNCGDFSIAPKYRSMGVAVKLRRAARDAIDAGRSPFLYAHPNDRMLQVHLRVGHLPLGRMVRYAKPLRLATPSGFVNGVSQHLLQMCGTDLLVRRRVETELMMADAVPRDLDDLYDRASEEIGTALVRDHSYLRWRFGHYPAQSNEVLIARRHGRPTAYVVFSQQGDSAAIKDWLGVNGDATQQVFAALLRELRARHVRAVSATLLETHRDLPVLRRFGFVARPEVSTVVTYAEADAVRCAVMDPSKWYMTVGDRDV